MAAYKDQVQHPPQDKGVHMRVLVVGAGRMGAIRVEDLVTDPRVEKVIVANRNEDRARALADLHGAEVAPWSAMADIDVDATVQHVLELQ